MRIQFVGKMLLLGATLASASGVLAQLSPAARPLTYGAAVTADSSRRIAAAAVAEAKRNGWVMAVAIVDTAGQLVYFEKMDDTQTGSVQASMDKAKSAALFRRPTKVFNEMLAGGNTYVLAIAGAIPVEGGLPLMQDGKVIGAIGISGGTGPQDGVTAKAGADQVK